MADLAFMSRSIWPAGCGLDPMSNGSPRRTTPSIPEHSLVPDYCGIRPKLTGPGEGQADFMIAGPADHGMPHLVNLFGIESPGLTSSLSLAEDVVKDLA
jgi:L-2-hydroxyglutarate oxidase LhgO